MTRFMLILSILIISILLYKIFKAQDKKVKFEDLSISNENRKFLNKIFEKKMKFDFLKSNKMVNFFIYKKNDFAFGKYNKNYDIIKVEVRKVSIQEQVLFSVTIKAWTSLLNYKKELDPDKTTTDILSEEDCLRSDVKIKMSGFFKPIKNNESKASTMETT